MDIRDLTNLMYKLGSFYGEIGETELEREQYSKVAELYSRLLHDEKFLSSHKKNAGY